MVRKEIRKFDVVWGVYEKLIWVELFGGKGKFNNDIGFGVVRYIGVNFLYF